MIKNEETCWYKEPTYKQMIAGAKGKLWPKLENSSHWPILKNMILKVPFDSVILDIGCGAACLSEQQIIKDHYNYIGYDLPNIINNVAKKLYPDEYYFEGDIFAQDMDNLNIVTLSDCIVMNAFIDALPKPLEILNKILPHCRKYVIIHRQYIGPKNTHVKHQSSYGGTTNISYINEEKFLQTVKDFDILFKVATGLGKDNYSVLLKGKENIE